MALLSLASRNTNWNVITAIKHYSSWASIKCNMENSHYLFRVLSTICEFDQDINSDYFLTISNLEIHVIDSSREWNMSDCRTGSKFRKLPQKVSGKQKSIVFLTSSGEYLSQLGLYTCAIMRWSRVWIYYVHQLLCE